MTLLEFLNKYLGKTKGYPTDSFYLGQCLSIVKLYIKECFGIDPPPSGTNSAYGYWSNFPNPLGTKFQKILNYKDTIPESGWIAIWQPWDGNQYGHIAIVSEGCTTGTLKNYAQNWTSKVFQLESNRYTNVIGFLKPIINLEDNMTPQEEAILKFVKETGATEGDIRQGIAYVKEGTVSKLEKDVEDLKTSLDSLEEKVTEINLKLEDKEDLITASSKELKTANKTISKLLEDLEVYKPYKARYESKCLETADKLNSWQLFKLLISKLSWKK